VNDRYHFSHRLTSEAAYAALLGQNRQLLHHHAADALRTRIIRGSAGEPVLLLQLLEHFEHSARWEDAYRCACELVETWARAGRPGADMTVMLQRAQLARDKAAHEFQARPPVELWLAQAAQAELQGQLATAEELAAQALAVASSADAVLEGRSLLSLSAVRRLQGHLAEAEELVQRAVRGLADAEQPRLYREARMRLAGICMARNRFREAQELYEELLEEFIAAGDLYGEAGIRLDLSLVLRAGGEMTAALANTQCALELAQRVGNRRMEGWLLGNLANQLSMSGQPREALRRLEQALAILHDVGDRATYALFLGNMGVTHEELGNTDEVRRCYEQSIAEHRALGTRHSLATMLSNLGDWHLQQGNAQQAAALGKEAVQLFAEIGDGVWQSWALTNLAAAELVLGEASAAEAHFAASLACAGRDHLPRQVEGLLAWAQARLQHPEMAQSGHPATQQLISTAAGIVSLLDEPLAAQFREQLAALAAGG
jgi:tetratricopeptide (TPR) repeat protein